ncbi:flagellar hook-length control protein FliK [Herbaspirillum lusitanum]|uniref:Flagellar hook-length control protein FliK n=1 Tax=Herbaspirillum lusitanum TaxID=213312 RepID=A0ABW9A5P5_9BURK
MLPLADATSYVKPVAPVDAATAIVSIADTKQEAVSRLSQIAIGQQMQGRILSNFNDGTYLVRIANTAARMVLPANAKTGDSLMLTLVAKDPRPTFSIVEGSHQQDEESAAVLLSNAGRAMQKDLKSLRSAQQGGTGQVAENPQLPDATGKSGQGAPLSSTSTSLSSAGKLISTLLQASQEDGIANHIVTTGALAPAGASSTQLAGALHDSLAYSGVFYESHVAAWSEGKRPAEELLKEPQAQAAKLLAPGTVLDQQDPAHTQLGQIINVQLNTLEQQRIVWQGEAWPGQPMEWEINQEQNSGHKQDNADESAPTWHSVVRFNFEHLGTVAASIRLIGQQIHVQIRTDSEQASNALKTNSRMFADSMAAAGTSLDSLMVKQDGEEA